MRHGRWAMPTLRGRAVYFGVIHVPRPAPSYSAAITEPQYAACPAGISKQDGHDPPAAEVCTR